MPDQDGLFLPSRGSCGSNRTDGGEVQTHQQNCTKVTRTDDVDHALCFYRPLPFKFHWCLQSSRCPGPDHDYGQKSSEQRQSGRQSQVVLIPYPQGQLRADISQWRHWSQSAYGARAELSARPQKVEPETSGSPMSVTAALAQASFRSVGRTNYSKIVRFGICT